MNGLTREQVEEKIEQGLVNRAVDSGAKTNKQIIMDNLFTYFNVIFMILSVLVCVAGSFRSLTFLPVVVGNTLIGIIQEIRYFSTYNFVGERVDGYEEPCSILTKEAARALKAVSNEMFVRGYRLKIFDTYRPAELFEKGYIAKMSSHSRGSTVDLTLLDMKTGKEVDMGSPFDLFSELSHPDCRDVTEEQFENRMMLQKVMVRNGFKPIDCEWWHFTLENEPYPDTYFEFPLSSDYLRR